MEEADEILLLSLRSAGCEIPAETTLHDFSPELLVESCSFCLQVICPTEKFATKLPEDPSGRFRVCNVLAAALQRLNYQGELSFHQFLYPNIQDSRKLLAHLLDQLPRTAAATAQDSATDESNVERAFAALGRWTSPYITKGRKATQPPSSPSTPSTLSHGTPFWTVKLQVHSEDGKFITSQPRQHALLAPSLLEYTALGTLRASAKEEHQFQMLQSTASEVHKAQRCTAETIAAAVTAALSTTDFGPREQADEEGKSPAQQEKVAAGVLGTPSSVAGSGVGGLFAHAAVFSLESKMVEAAQSVAGGEAGAGAEAGEQDPVAKVETAEERVERAEKECAELRTKLEATALSVATVQAEAAKAAELHREAAVALEAAAEKTPALEQEYLSKKQATQIVLAAESGQKSCEQSMQEIQTQVAQQQDRLKALHREWETKRRPLETKLEERLKATNKKVETAERQVAAIRQMRGEMRTMLVAAREREEQYKQLLAEYEGATKTVQRNTFVHRIMEIIKNIKHQEADICNIIRDTREVQREIKTATEQLNRVHAQIDEVVFQYARKDPGCKQAYINLNKIHSNFAVLIENAEAVGRSKREGTELERKIEELAQRPHDMEQIEKDIEVVRAEHQQLEAQIRKHRRE